MTYFLLSVSRVLPIFLFIALGMLLRKKGVLDAKLTTGMNRVSFRVFLPFLLFHNVSETSNDLQMDWQLILFTLAAVLLFFCGSWLVTCFFEKDRKKIPVIVQGMFRGNYILFGLPLAANILPEGELGSISLMIGIIVPVYNVLATVVLEYYCVEKISWKQLFVNILKNPMIRGSLLGLIVYLLHIPIPAMIHGVVEDIADMATPLALIVLGASFQIRSIASRKKALFWSVIGKLVIFPMLVLPVAVLLGFRDATLMAIFPLCVAPTATASFTMADAVGADSDLASQIVVFTSLFSVFTITLFMSILMQGGWIAP